MSVKIAFSLAAAACSALLFTESACAQATKRPVLDVAFALETALSAEEAKQKEKSEPKRKGKFTIGKETTYVDGPLDKDGYIDYLAALNKRLAHGVTPENNATVLIVKALGPRPEGARLPASFFQRLGIEALPEKGDYFIGLSRYLRERMKIESEEKVLEIGIELQNWAAHRPWTAKEYPHLASWLEANERPLALIVEATKRTQYYLPRYVRDTAKDKSSMIGVQMPTVYSGREVGEALAARAMLHSARPEEAWRDLIACHRLGRLVGRRGTMIESLVGIAIDGIACRADVAFLEFARPDAKQIEKALVDLGQLTPFELADKVNLTERFVALEMVMLMDRWGFEDLEERRLANPNTYRLFENMDWDPSLRNVNSSYDRAAAAIREKRRADRVKKLNEIVAELNKKVEKNAPPPTPVQRLFKVFHLVSADQVYRERREAIDNVELPLFLPAIQKLVDAVDRSTQTHDNLTIAFALAWHHKVNGSYPNELSELAPKYLKRIPPDMFSGKPLIYRPGAKGYWLYSVGVDGKDENRRGRDDKPAGDDLSIRVPLPELRK